MHRIRRAGLTFRIVDEADPERESAAAVGDPELEEGGVLRGVHGRQVDPLLGAAAHLLRARRHRQRVVELARKDLPVHLPAVEELRTREKCLL